MQDEAQRNSGGDNPDHGVSSTMTELHMAINHNLLLPQGSIPDLSMSSSIERIDTLFHYFFRSYLRMPFYNAYEKRPLIRPLQPRNQIWIEKNYKTMQAI